MCEQRVVNLWVPGSPSWQCWGAPTGALLVGYSNTSLSKGQPQREQAKEFCLGDSYGYSMCDYPGSSCSLRKCCRELGWRGDPSSLQPYLYVAHTILKYPLMLEKKKKKLYPLLGVFGKEGEEMRKVESWADLWCCQVPWPERSTTSLSKCCLPPWGCPSLFSTWLVVLLSPIWRDSHVT